MRRELRLSVSFASLALSAIALAPCLQGCGGDDSGTVGNNGTPDGSVIGTQDGGNFFVGNDSGQVSDGAGFDGQSCASSNVDARRAKANLLFIIDRSGSMSCNPPPTQTSAACEASPAPVQPTAPTKWSITRDALKQAIAAMPNTNSVGVTYFNTDDDCGVRGQPNVALATVDTAQVTALNNSLNAVTPKGLTPIVGGVTLGYDYLHSNSFQGKKFLVLITDGDETCAPSYVTTFVNQTVKDALSVGIRTFVIGAPGSENNRAMLSQVAFNGGTARTPTCTHAANPANQGDCHFDLTGSGATTLAQDLNRALDTIAREALGCEYDVPPAGDAGLIDYNKVNVVYTPSGGGAAQGLLQDTRDCASTANGWQYSKDRTKIFLCGQACTDVKNDPGGKVQIELGCATNIR